MEIKVFLSDLNLGGNSTVPALNPSLHVPMFKILSLCKKQHMKSLNNSFQETEKIHKILISILISSLYIKFCKHGFKTRNFS